MKKDNLQPSRGGVDARPRVVLNQDRVRMIHLCTCMYMYMYIVRTYNTIYCMYGCWNCYTPTCTYHSEVLALLSTT